MNILKKISNRVFDRAHDLLPSGKRVTKNLTRDLLTFGAGGAIGKVVGGTIGSFLGPAGTVAGSVIGSGIASGFIGKAFNKAADRQRLGTDQKLNGDPDYDSFGPSDADYRQRSFTRDALWGGGLQAVSSILPLLTNGGGTNGLSGGFAQPAFGDNFGALNSGGLGARFNEIAGINQPSFALPANDFGILNSFNQFG